MEVAQYLFLVVLVALLWNSRGEPEVNVITTPYGFAVRENTKGIFGITLSWCVFAVILFLILFQLCMRRHCCHDPAAALGGLNRDAIDECPIFVYSTVKELKMGNGAGECAVCLSEFEDRDTIKMMPKCEHVFHRRCIDAWLSSRMNCPICRQNLVSGSYDNDNDTVVDIIDVPTNAPTEQQELGSTAECTESEVAVTAADVRQARESRRLGRSFSMGPSIVGSEENVRET